jgi:outer membrane protein TolC
MGNWMEDSESNLLPTVIVLSSVLSFWCVANRELIANGFHNRLASGTTARLPRRRDLARATEPRNSQWWINCIRGIGTEVKGNHKRALRAGTCGKIILLAAISRLFAQSPPFSPDHPWHSTDERQVISDAQRLHYQSLRIEPDRAYSLAELIDLAEAHNPETRVAWESARAQAAALGIARSELFPTLAAVALAGVDREEASLGSQFYRHTIGDFQISLTLNYTIFDFGARRGRINEESARLLASNFGFNDVHRQLIYDVSEAYYRLLNAAGQKEAAGASLVNAQNVQQAAEERLRNGLATLPDVLDARSATAQAQYDLQAVLGAEQIARGDLLTALGAPALTAIRVQPLSEVPTPESVADTVEMAISRALEQRPDLQTQFAEIRLTQAERQQARAAFYPNLTVTANPSAQSLSILQQTLPWGHTADLTGAVAFMLSWTVFDGGARRNRLAEAEAHVRQAKAQVSATRDRIEDQVWTAYSNLNTAFRQREAARELVNAATQSYSAALESYNYGVRNLLDVTNAQKVLAQARSTDVLAQTQVLAALADLSFRTGDAIQANMRKTHP